MKSFIKISLLGVVIAAQVAPAFAEGHGLEGLMQAISESKPEEVVAILNDSANPVDLNAKSASGPTKDWTPLALAAAKGDVPSLKHLLEKGAKLDQQIKLNDKTVSPLILAAMHERTEVMKEILNSPSFGAEGYRREMQLAQRLQQSSLLEHLRAAKEAEGVARDARALLESSAAPAHETCHRDALERFPGDSIAQMQQDVCLICQQLPGETGSFELMNGLKRTGDHVTTGCCHARFCSACLQGYRQHTGRQSPRCAGCREATPSYEEFKNSITALVWRGDKIAIPGHAVAAAEVPGAGGVAQGAGVPQASLVAQGIARVGEGHPRYHELSPAFRALGNMYEVAGLIWSGVAPREMNQRDAVAYCAGLGGGARLPTKDEYVALSGAMGSRQPEYRDNGGNARADYDVAGYHRNLIPDMNNRLFWSASVHPLYEDSAFFFDGNVGRVVFDGRYSYKSVRCVVGGL